MLQVSSVNVLMIQTLSMELTFHILLFNPSESPVRSPVHSRPETPVTPIPIPEDWQDSGKTHTHTQAHMQVLGLLVLSSPDKEEVGGPAPSPPPLVFSRLEETRVLLETQLGLASLLQAYHLIQVVTCSQLPHPGSRM